MTLEETLLQKLADWRPPGGGRHTLAVSDETAWVVRVTAERRDDLGCALWEMVAERTEPRADKKRTVGDWAEQVAGRVTGLQEPLAVVEVDTLRDMALGVR